MQTLLEARKLRKEYQRGGKSFPAVNDVDFALQRGEFVGLVGCSGSGKSTLLHLLSGLLTPTAGEVLVEGKELSGMSDREKAALRNARIGYIPQGTGLLENLSVLDNIRLPLHLWQCEGPDADRAVYLLEQVGMAGFGEAYPAELSGGEMRRVAIARALMNEPALVIADEPTSDLDAETTEQVMALLGRLHAAGTTLLLVTHEPETLRGADRVLAMRDGAFVSS